MEYLVIMEWPDGTQSMVPDPTNPRRVRSVFGDKSEIEFPGYSRPWWLSVGDAADAQARWDAEARTFVPVAVRTPSTPQDDPAMRVPAAGEVVVSVRTRPRDSGGDDRRHWELASWEDSPGAPVPDRRTAEVVDEDAAVAISGQLHVPADSTPAAPLPLLVVHDGPEYADLAQLLRYVSTLAVIEPGLRCRVLLLQPIDRDRSYSASPAYARALVNGMLPRVTEAFATSGRPVGMGASLGGLAMLHAATSYPGTFAGVFSQAGSFFRPRTDGMERGFRHYDRIVRFVEDLDLDPHRLADLLVRLTCGTGEENLANNRSLAQRLNRLGVAVELVENPDGHNYTAWRDCLDPGLRLLLREAWNGTGIPPT